MGAVERTLVVVVTYNAASWVDYCLAPFKEESPVLDILVIDNASSDGTPERIQAAYPYVRVIKRPTNLGFGRANNIGLELALVERYSGVLLLNQDAQCSPSVIRQLAKRVAEDPSIGLASPVHYSDETYSRRESGFAHYCPPEVKEGFIERPFINAAIWYIPRRTLLKVGGFSPLFFHYGEDLDFYHNVLHHGLRAGYYPDLKAVHRREPSLLSKEKKGHLEYAYHLAQFLNPNLPTWKRYTKGVLALLWKGIRKGSLERIKKAGELYALREEVSLWLHRPAPNVKGLQRLSLHTHCRAPVLLVVYNRPAHTRRILECLLAQPEIIDTPLYILSDGGEHKGVKAVRTILRESMPYLPPDTTLWFNEENKGLAQNIVSGIERVLERHDRVIVLEDDLRLAPYALRWFNDCLDMYKYAPNIAHIHGGTFYDHPCLSENHLLAFAGSWGWATWREKWVSYWNPDGEALLQELMNYPQLEQRFEYGGYQNFTRMLRHQIEGRNNSWAIRWHASLLLRGQLSANAHPAVVMNDGFDGTGVHSNNDNRHRTPLCPYPLYATPSTEYSEDTNAYHLLFDYYRKHYNKFVKGIRRIKEIWRNISF